MTAMTFKSLLKEKDAKVYSYVLKLAIPSVDDKCIDCLTESLQKYELVSSDKFVSTPPQTAPLDFPNVKNMPVHRSKISLKYPASPDFLQNYLAQTLGIPLTFIVVQNEADPRLADADAYLERNMPEFKQKYVPLLGSDYPANDNVQGLQMAADMSVKDATECDSRKIQTATNSLIPDQVIDHTGLEGYNVKPTEQTGTLFGRTVKSKA